MLEGANAQEKAFIEKLKKTLKRITKKLLIIKSCKINIDKFYFFMAQNKGNISKEDNLQSEGNFQISCIYDLKANQVLYLSGKIE